MKDRKLEPTEKNTIDSCRKMATWGVFHNINKNPNVVAFNSKLANEIFSNLISEINVPAKVMYESKMDFNGMWVPGDAHVRDKILEMSDWLSVSCSGYFVLIDYNVFFELEEDKASFILKFSNQD